MLGDFRSQSQSRKVDAAAAKKRKSKTTELSDNWQFFCLLVKQHNLSLCEKTIE